jgi:hypothetical protein
MSFTGHTINMRANDVCGRQAHRVQAQARETSSLYVFSCFPREVATVGDKLLERIKGTLHELQEGTICNRTKQAGDQRNAE